MSAIAPTENSTALTVATTALDARQQELAEYQAFRAEVEAMKNLIAKDTNDEELSLFCKVAKKSGLDPFMRQIYAVMRNGKMSIQVGIDGLRLIADRSGLYEGQLGPQWCGADGVWRDVWLSKEPPAAARVGILKRGFREPLWAVARWDSYVQLDRGGKPTRMWATMGDVMLAKCAEALGLRKTFPAESQGLYTDDEMGQADNPEPTQQRPDRSPEQQASDQELGAWIAQRDRLFRVGEQKFPGDKARSLALVARFCEKFSLLALDSAGKADLEGSTAAQIRNAADVLQAWTPEAAPAPTEQPPEPSEHVEAEIVDDDEPVFQDGFSLDEQRLLEDEADF